MGGISESSNYSMTDKTIDSEDKDYYPPAKQISDIHVDHIASANKSVKKPMDPSKNTRFYLVLFIIIVILHLPTLLIPGRWKKKILGKKYDAYFFWIIRLQNKAGIHPIIELEDGSIIG